MNIRPEITDDAVLGGRLQLRQPRRGHRVGHDAILLAAATFAQSGDHAVELGAGVGAAGLALAQRVPGLRVTLAEIDPHLVALANENAARNGLGDRVTAVVADVESDRALSVSGVTAGCVQVVLMNPPFNDPASAQVSPDAGRARAHVATADTLAAWIATAARLLCPGGSLTLIWRADGLAAVLAALAGFGNVALLPVHGRPDAAAIRILAQATKGSRTALRVLPGLVLNDARGRPTAAAEAVLRGAAPLPLA
jgi:tRNA1(Val) A37 N6-methylase TrmN6